MLSVMEVLARDDSLDRVFLVYHREVTQTHCAENIEGLPHGALELHCDRSDVHVRAQVNVFATLEVSQPNLLN